MLPHMKAFGVFIERKQNNFFFEQPNNQKQKQNVIFRAPPILNIFFVFSQLKDQRLSYEVAFIFALWMVSSES